MEPHAPRQKSHISDGRTERQTSCYMGNGNLYLVKAQYSEFWHVYPNAILLTLSITVENITQNLKGIWVDLRGQSISECMSR